MRSSADRAKNAGFQERSFVRIRNFALRHPATGCGKSTSMPDRPQCQLPFTAHIGLGRRHALETKSSWAVVNEEVCRSRLAVAISRAGDRTAGKGLFLRHGGTATSG